MKALEPAEPVRRYERATPGEMIHIDIKKLGRFDRSDTALPAIARARATEGSRRIGWEFVHVCIDDTSRVAFSQIMPDEKADSAVPFLKAAVAYYTSLGVTVTRVMTDNGSCYKAFAFRNACRDLGIRHIRTSPTPPKLTERPSASSRPPSGSGPTPKPIPHHSVAPRNSPPGCTDTTGIGPTAV